MNTIGIHILKNLGPCLPNRDENGDAKQVMVGQVRRARISSQCLKRAIRKYMKIESLRTAHLEDYVEAILMQLVDEGTIPKKSVETLGPVICGYLDCDWKKRKSANPEKAKGEKDEDSKGRTVVVTNPAEIDAVVDAVINCKKEKDIDKDVAAALSKVSISIDKALFGTMSTSGSLGTVDGAVSLSQSFSIDEYNPENDYITAVFSEADADKSDPFFGVYNSFVDKQRTKKGSENIASSWLYSNTMYTSAFVNVDILKKNLEMSIYGQDSNKVSVKADVKENDVKNQMKESVGGFAEALAVVEPAGKQNNMATHVAPVIFYIEAVKNGNCDSMPDFQRVVRRHDKKEIPELGIERILEFGTDTTFRRGAINRYVMFSAPYKAYEKKFEEQGIKVLHNLDELSNVLGKEVERLLK